MRNLVKVMLIALLALGATGRVEAADAPPDRDFYLSDTDPEIARDLRIVQYAHVDKVLPWMREGRLNMAISELQFTLYLFPNHPEALMLSEAVSKVAKTPYLAQGFYERAIALFPEYAITHAQYGHYLVSIGRVSEGIESLRRATEMDPSLAAGFGWLAEAYEKAGKAELARQVAKQAAQLGYSSK
jgi:tetratricopeptide (TPR) repeat protein